MQQTFEDSYGNFLMNYRQILEINQAVDEAALKR